jgi:uncharacterized protein YeaO (DUF488 family)
LEARVGFEPTNGGFADLSLGPLGYRAQCPPVYRKASEDVSEASEAGKCWPHGLRKCWPHPSELRASGLRKCWPHGLRKTKLEFKL